MGEIAMLRHGETEWSAARRHTSYSDIELTPNGEQQAVDAGKALAGRSFVAVLCSPRRRALRTAELAGLTVTRVVDDLAEWNYGRYEGITKAQVWADRPDWDQWTDGFPDGESVAQIGARLDRVLAEVRPLLERGDVALIAHGHSLRVAGARWVGLPVSAGGLMGLDTAARCVLGHEYDRPVIRRWNCGP